MSEKTLSAIDQIAMGPERYVRIQTVANHMDVTVRTVKNRMRAGLPHYAFGRWLSLFKLSEVDTWLARECRRVFIQGESE